MTWLRDYLAAWDTHDPDRVMAFLADDVSYEDLAVGAIHHGRDEVREFVAGASFFSSDYRFEIVSEQASADRYALEWEMVGTHTGGGGDAPATQKPYRIRGVSIGTLNADGKILVNRDYWNMVDFLEQVGLMPAPGS